MAFTVVVDKSQGDIFTEAMWDTMIRDNLNKGVIRPIAEVSLASPAATIDFTSIAADWAHLLIAWLARSDVAANSANLVLRFNNDAGANYDSQNISGTGTTAAAGESLATTSGIVGQIPGASALANQFGGGLVIIPHYTNAVARKVGLGMAQLGWNVTTGSLRFMLSGTMWRSAPAISRITFFPSASNFVADSRVTLYGMGGI
ncbi:MAG: hypothetical protein ACRDM7_13120 [Thermoleophilaceae bacterium]